MNYFDDVTLESKFKSLMTGDDTTPEDDIVDEDLGEEIDDLDLATMEVDDDIDEILSEGESIGDDGDDLTELVGLVSTLEMISNIAHESKTNGGFNTRELTLVQMLLQRYEVKMGAKIIDLPSMESYGSSVTRLAATDGIAIESDKKSNGWGAKVKDYIVDLFKRFGDFLKRLVSSEERVKSWAKKATAAIDKIKGEGAPDKLDVNVTYTGAYRYNSDWLNDKILGKIPAALGVELLDAIDLKNNIKITLDDATKLFYVIDDSGVSGVDKYTEHRELMKEILGGKEAEKIAELTALADMNMVFSSGFEDLAKKLKVKPKDKNYEMPIVSLSDAAKTVDGVAESIEALAEYRKNADKDSSEIKAIINKGKDIKSDTHPKQAKIFFKALSGVNKTFNTTVSRVSNCVLNICQECVKDVNLTIREYAKAAKKAEA